jgi:glycogen operon protein
LLFHVMFNAYWEPLVFELGPVVSGVHGPWRRWIDTDQDAPHDIYEWPGGPAVEGPSYTVQARSLAVLFALSGTSR